MSVEHVIYLDSSAIVKLAVEEPESLALRQFLRQGHPCVSSALAQTEVARALLPLGPEAVRRGREVVSRLELIRVSTRILIAAGRLRPIELRSLDAIHLATAEQLQRSLTRLVTYDQRLASAAQAVGWSVLSPS